MPQPFPYINSYKRQYATIPNIIEGSIIGVFNSANEIPTTNASILVAIASIVISFIELS